MEVNSILKLKELLKKEDIPFIWESVPYLNGYHIHYPTSNIEDRVCSVIEFEGSYGYEDDELEILGLLSDEELKNDSVLGNLSTEEVFKRIKNHYRRNRKMTNYVKLFMEENDIEIGEWFKLKHRSGLLMHITNKYILLDTEGAAYNYTLNQLLAGSYTIVKLKIKLTKEQYDFINSFKGISSFEIEKDGFDSLLRLNLDNGDNPYFNLDIIKINFDNLEKDKVYYIKDIDADYAEAA